MSKSKTEYRHVYKGTPFSRACKAMYQYNFKYKHTTYYGSYPTAREAAVACDKKFISLGLIERLQILKPC